MKVNRKDSSDSRSELEFLLPRDTFTLLKLENKENIRDVENQLLKFQKIPWFNSKNKKFTLYETEKNRPQYKIELDYSGLNWIKEKVLTDNETILQGMRNAGYIFKELFFSENWRLAIGLGADSVYETSLTLHHIYGIPYIPGQAVKGITRNFILSEVYSSLDNSEENNKENKAEINASRDPLFCRIFGSAAEEDSKEAQKGSVIFLDVYPVNKLPRAEIDILNPHYVNYYRDSSNQVFPTDDQNPVPVYFLTVTDSCFKFSVGVKEKENIIQDPEIDSSLFSYSKKLFPKLDNKSTLLDVIELWLDKALREQGIGAKTAVGYGKFGREREMEKKYREQKEMIKKEERKKQQLASMSPLRREMEEEGYSTNADAFMERLTKKWLPRLESPAELEEHKKEIALHLAQWYQQFKPNQWQKPNRKNEAKIKIIRRYLGEEQDN